MLRHVGAACRVGRVAESFVTTTETTISFGLIGSVGRLLLHKILRYQIHQGKSCGGRERPRGGPMNARRRELIASGFIPANPLAAGLRMLKPGETSTDRFAIHTRALSARLGCEIRRRSGLVAFPTRWKRESATARLSRASGHGACPQQGKRCAGVARLVARADGQK